MRLFQRTLVQPQPLGHRFDRFLLADDPFGELYFSQSEAIAGVAKDHVARNARLLRDHVNHVLGFDDHRVRLVDFNFHGSSIEPANRLVRQVQVPNVLRRHFQSGVDSFVRNLH